jgi:hypothetical protein
MESNLNSNNQNLLNNYNNQQNEQIQQNQQNFTGNMFTNMELDENNFMVINLF